MATDADSFKVSLALGGVAALGEKRGGVYLALADEVGEVLHCVLFHNGAQIVGGGIEDGDDFGRIGAGRLGYAAGGGFIFGALLLAVFALVVPAVARLATPCGVAGLL